MKLTVLGCWGAYPEAGGATSGYLLETDLHKILIDCGSGVLAQLFKHIPIEQLDAVFLSHYHHDHCADLGCLSYASRFAMVFHKRQSPLPIMANNRSKRFSELNYKEYTKGVAISPKEEIQLKGLKVSFAETVHEEYNLAMRFEYQGKAFVYTGDMGPTSNLTQFCQGADLMVCETSLFAKEAGLFSGHMTTTETAKLAEDAHVKKLIISHFPHSPEIDKMPSEVSRSYQGAVYLAEINNTYQV